MANTVIVELDRVRSDRVEDAARAPTVRARLAVKRREVSQGSLEILDEHGTKTPLENKEAAAGCRGGSGPEGLGEMPYLPRTA